MNEMAVTDYWKEGFVRIFKYRGRASRKEFLSIFLLNIIVGIFLNIIVAPLEHSSGDVNAPLGIFLLLISIFGVAVYLAQISAQCRRLHDLGISGLWILFGYLLIIFSIVFILMASPSKGDSGAMGVFSFMCGSGGLLLFVLFLISCFMPTGKKDNKYGPSLRKTW